MTAQHVMVADLYRQEVGGLRRQLQRKLGDLAAAEDVAQDAYLRMLKLPAAQEELRSPKAFLFTIASNLAIDSMRREQRSARRFGPCDFDADEAQDEEIFVCPLRPVDEQVDMKLRLSVIVRRLHELPDNCRRAFMLHKFDDHSYAEVACLLGVSVSMVEKHVSRALAHLRQFPELFED